MHIEHGTEKTKYSNLLSNVTDGSINSKHLEANQGVPDGDGSSKYIEGDEDSDGSEISDHFDLNPRLFSVLRSGKDLYIFPEVDIESIDSKPAAIDSEIGGTTECSRHLLAHTENSGNGNCTDFPCKQPVSSYLSSSGSSMEDLFQVDTDGVKRSSQCTTSFHAPNEDTHMSIKEYENTSNSLKTVEHRSKSLEFAVQAANVTSVSAVASLSPTKSPAVQLMDREDTYDADRIPSSIFASISTTPVEWSIASNESLFSLNIGNNSFSKDRFLMFDREFCKSEELKKSGEFVVSPPPTDPMMKSDERGPEAAKKFAKTGATEQTSDCVTDRLSPIKSCNASCNSLHCERSYQSYPTVNSSVSFAFSFCSLAQKDDKQHSLQQTASEESPASGRWWRCLSCYPYHERHQFHCCHYC